MRDHRDFERKPGRLLSVEGKVLEPSGGNTVSVKFDGKQIEPADWDHTRFEKNGTLTVTPGTDLTEEHTVEQRKVPFKTDINLNGGPVQIVTQQGEDGLQEFWVGRQSKKTAAKTVIRKQEPLIVKSFAPRPEGKKVIALTFDDGPSIYSDKILDILKQNKVKATFFELGEQSLEFPKVEQRIVREGHQIASHSVSHPYFPNMSAQEQRQEIESSLSDIKKASDVSTRTFRAPYGAFGVDEWKNNATLIDRNVLWDVDTLDWKRPGEKQITKEVVDYVHNGAVVLMHSGGGDRSQTVKALQCTDAAQDLPILRPLIGMDKTEIIETSRHINTFETSILPYEDCCTIFTPPHPKIRPELEEILAAEAAMPGLAALEAEAAEQTERIRVRITDQVEFEG